MELTSLIIAAVAAIGTWIQIVVQWRKDSTAEMNPEISSSVVVIQRRAAAGIVCGLLFWSAATGYLAYRMVTTPHNAPTIDPQKIIATFDSNSWALAVDRHSAFIAVIATNLGPEAEKYHIVAVAIVADAKVDINVDTRVNRSSEYTIVQGVTGIEIPISSTDQKRLRSGGGIDFLVVAVPQEYASSQITSLSKLKSLRGQIVIHHGMGVPKGP